MIFAKEFGFLPENDGLKNAAALQKAVDCAGDIYVDIPGVYALADTIYLEDNTTLIFCNGAYIKRENNPESNGYVLANRGAFSGEYNQNIKIIGMKLVCNNVQSDRYVVDCTNRVLGLSAHLAFHRIKNLEIRDFEVHDLPNEDFAIQVCTFENILIENGYIEGLKDGIHLGNGNMFTIRHFKFRTFDDPIALNAHDYATSNPEMGWIQNGIIEDCYDLDDSSTTGFFCRILAGSWGEWKKGMEIQNSDSVAYKGKVYRAFMKPDNTLYTANATPDENVGKPNSDGIVWCITQNDISRNCGCRNIVFRNIFLQKKRPTAFSIHFDKDAYSRSYYPYTEAPVQENITFEHVYCQNEVPVLLYSRTPMNNIRFSNCILKNNHVLIDNIHTAGICYNVSNLSFDKTAFTGDSGLPFVVADHGIKVKLSIKDSFTPSKDFKATLKGDVMIKESDISLS